MKMTLETTRHIEETKTSFIPKPPMQAASYILLMQNILIYDFCVLNSQHISTNPPLYAFRPKYTYY